MLVPSYAAGLGSGALPKPESAYTKAVNRDRTPEIVCVEERCR
jgi:hypothetical protein